MDDKNPIGKFSYCTSPKCGACIYQGCKICKYCLADQLAEKDGQLAAAVERAKRARNHEQLAVKCICDVETYLELGSPKFIRKVINDWRGASEVRKEMTI